MIRRKQKFSTIKRKTEIHHDQTKTRNCEFYTIERKKKKTEILHDQTKTEISHDFTKTRYCELYTIERKQENRNFTPKRKHKFYVM